MSNKNPFLSEMLPNVFPLETPFLTLITDALGLSMNRNIRTKSPLERKKNHVVASHGFRDFFYKENNTGSDPLLACCEVGKHICYTVDNVRERRRIVLIHGSNNCVSDIEKLAHITNWDDLILMNASHVHCLGGTRNCIIYCESSFRHSHMWFIHYDALY